MGLTWVKDVMAVAFSQAGSSLMLPSSRGSTLRAIALKVGAAPRDDESIDEKINAKSVTLFKFIYLLRR